METVKSMTTKEFNEHINNLAKQMEPVRQAKKELHYCKFLITQIKSELK